MKTTIRLHPLAAQPELGPAAAPDAEIADSLLAALRDADADTTQADVLMRAALQALLQWQLQAGAPTPSQIRFGAARVDTQLQGFAEWCAAREFGRSWTETQLGWWAHCRKVIAASFEAQPQWSVHGDFSPARLSLAVPAAVFAAPVTVGPASYDLASLLRDPLCAWEEEQELDWAIRYWEHARKAGLPIDADFGTFWQQLEWTGLLRHLAMAGQVCRLKFERSSEGQVMPDAASE